MRRIPALLALALAAPLVAPSAQLPVVTPARLAAPATVPLQRPFGRLRTIRVVVGRDTLDFLFDTGGGVTVVSPAVAAKLGCVAAGHNVGFRMTGEKLAGEQCAEVALGIGPLTYRGPAGVMDLNTMLGPRAPHVDGMISLQSLAGHAVTLDLAHDRLTVETERSLDARTRGMTPLAARLATGPSGAELTAFVALPVGGAQGALWLEWDSGHMATTFLAPHAAAALGLDSTVQQGDVTLPLAPTLRVAAAGRVKDVIYDGVLSAAFIERAAWTVDLAHARMWVGPVAAVPTMPQQTTAAVVAPSADPVGWYEMTVVVRGRPEPGVLHVVRDGTSLVGELRAFGEDDVVHIHDLVVRGSTMEFTVPLGGRVPVQLTFDGLQATGTWGDGGVQRGGAASAVKKS